MAYFIIRRKRLCPSERDMIPSQRSILTDSRARSKSVYAAALFRNVKHSFKFSIFLAS